MKVEADDTIVAHPVAHRSRQTTKLPDGWHLYIADDRPTPQSTIDAVIYCIRERGIAALKEPLNIERLSRCDQAARARINDFIHTLVHKGVIIK